MNSCTHTHLDDAVDLVAEIFIDAPISSGTYRLRGGSNFRGIGTLAYLQLHEIDEVKAFPVLLSGNGRFFELVEVSRRVTRIVLSVKRTEHSSTSLQLDHVEFEPISRFKRYWIYATIALATWYRLPRSQRYHHNLFFYSPLLNPKRAYQSVQQYRFKYGSIAYEQWLDEVDALSPAERALIKRFSNRLQSKVESNPFIVVDARIYAGWSLEGTIDSIRASFSQPSCVYVLTEAKESLEASLPSRLGTQKIQYVTLHELADDLKVRPVNQHLIWLTAGCRLAESALTWFTAEISKEPSLSFLYSDHDHLTTHGQRHTPHFKPDWSDELAFASGYPGAVVCVQVHHFYDCLLNSRSVSAYSLMLYAGGQRDSYVLHIPSILWHAPEALLKPNGLDAECLRTFLHAQGREANVSLDAESGCLRIKDPVPEPAPLVSIIIPTRDRLDLLVPCVESVLSQTAYQNFEILIVDNQSQEVDTLKYFHEICADRRVRVLCFDHPFNYAAINNFAVTQAQGSLLCLLNNDTRVLNSEWLSEMVSALHLDRVGVVGAQLRYPNGRLQHAGDLVGGSGCANHLHGPLEVGDQGYMQRVVLRQDLSAVTAACLLTFKALYQSLGGLDQRRLKVAFNDVDYCLRVREAGYRVLYTPFAQLIHYESESRGADISSRKRRQSFREAQYMRKRWYKVMHRDPFYNPNLNYYRCDFSLDPAPSIPKPWD